MPKLGELLATTMFTGMMAAATPALAQEAAGQNPPDNDRVPAVPETAVLQGGETSVPQRPGGGENARLQGDIVITGTRIPQPNLTSASPVTVLSAQEVKL